MEQDNEIIKIILMALLPVAILLFYIYNKDRESPEPIGVLTKTFIFGIISAPLSMLISTPLGTLGFYSDTSVSITNSIATAFFGAAIPEEAAKLFMLWLVLRNNKYFDEKTDGIVYAVFISMGFAAIENILYLFANYDSYVSTGVVRGLFSIPGHFCFGVIMGYYYSLATFYRKNKRRNTILILVAPIIAHGLYDAVLMTAGVTSELISLALTIVFLILCNKMWKYGSARIKELLNRDGI